MSFFPKKAIPTELDLAIEDRKTRIRRGLRACESELDSVESLRGRGRLTEAVSHSQELVRSFIRLACLLYSPFDNRTAIAVDVPDDALPELPEGKFRQELTALFEQTRGATVAPSADDLDWSAKAIVRTADRLLTTAKRTVRQKRTGELRTAKDLYRSQMVLAVVKIVALIALPAGIYAFWYQMSVPRVTIVEATFGGNCDGVGPPGGPRHSIVRGNATQLAGAACNDARAGCNLSIDGGLFGDPAPMCAKDFTVAWLCSDDRVPHQAIAAAEATGKSIPLSCGTGPRITIREATYGANCEGKLTPVGGSYSVARGNWTGTVARLCNSAGRCSVTVGTEPLGDPAPSCAKEFEVAWSCSQDSRVRTGQLGAEAMGRAIVVSCD
jgi:hypothetical protein